METTEKQTVYPIITRDTTPRWEDVFGKRTWVLETVTTDWGPVRGVSKVFITAPENDDPERNARELNRVLARLGYRLKGNGSTLPDGFTRRSGPEE